MWYIISMLREVFPVLVAVGWQSASVMMTADEQAMAGPTVDTAAAGKSDNRLKDRKPLQAPTLHEHQPIDYKGLRNVVAYHDGYLSGSIPEGDAGFDALVAMEVKTIISVDGAVPDVERAKARGMRYIHLPIGYNGFDEKRKLQLTRATRDAIADGPVYIHCHHGKHRSASAAGAVAVSLGWLTNDQAVQRMKISGTAVTYQGLYKCVEESKLIDSQIMDAVAADFPEISYPATFLKAMVEIDHIHDHLKAVDHAGWIVPKDHPDLVPVAEAGRMADLLRLVLNTDKVKSQPEEFRAIMRLNAEQTQALEHMLLEQKPDARKLSEQFKLIQASCRDCHTRYRD